MSASRRTVTVPGKIILAGEYAVLEHAEAVAVAVDRRARAQLADEPLAKLNPFVKAVREEMAESTAFGGVGRAALNAIRRVQVDVSALHNQDGAKFGLGSSAATTVAAAACALSSQSGELPLDLIHRLAHGAHGEAQSLRGTRGSGADIAACTYGGVIAVRMVDLGRPVEVRRLTWPAAARLVFVWTGQPADTATLVASVRACRVSDRRSYDTAITRIAETSADVIEAIELADLPALINAIDGGGEAVEGLARAADIELVLPVHRQVRELARAQGGAAKPTGAAGGDVVAAVFAADQGAEAFVERCRAEGLTLLDAGIAETGVALG